MLRDFGEEIERIEDLEVAGGAGQQFLIPVVKGSVLTIDTDKGRFAPLGSGGFGKSH